MQKVREKVVKLSLVLALILTMVGCASENKKLDEQADEVLAPIIETEDSPSSGG